MRLINGRACTAFVGSIFVQLPVKVPLAGERMKTGGLWLGVVFLGICGVARAQGGCINSPESPTVVLAMIGSAGALLVSLRRRSRW